MDDGVEILLVEDDTAAEILARLAFKQQGVTQVHFVRDGAEALEFLFCTGDYADRVRENPKLVLLDIKVPLVDGLEVLRHIRNDVRTRTIPVVILSSSNEECDVIEAYALGVNSYIVKPLDFDEFSDVAKDLTHYWLRRNRQPCYGSESSTEIFSGRSSIGIGVS